MFKSKSEKRWIEAQHSDIITVRLDPQHHEIRIQPVLNAGSVYSAQEQRQYQVMESLRDLAQNAAFMLMQAGLQAEAGKPLTAEHVQRALDWRQDQKDIELEASRNLIERLEKELAEKEIEVRALTRALRS